MDATDGGSWRRGSDDALAAEYVLGSLPPDERRTVAQRVEADAEFARLVDHWEALLAPMAGTYPEVDRSDFANREPEGPRLQAPAAARPNVGLWQSLAFWRGLAGAACAALTLVLLVPLLNPPDPVPPTHLVASLAAEGSDVRYMAVYDPIAQDIGLSHISGSTPEGRALELWVIVGDGAPRSIGIIPEGGTAHLEPDTPARQLIGEGALFAISVEPRGGSPTGQPTGPVVAAGDLRSL